MALFSGSRRTPNWVVALGISKEKALCVYTFFLCWYPAQPPKWAFVDLPSLCQLNSGLDLSLLKPDTPSSGEPSAKCRRATQRRAFTVGWSGLPPNKKHELCEFGRRQRVLTSWLQQNVHNELQTRKSLK